MANESKSLVSEEQVAKPAVRVGTPRGILTVDASAAQVQKQEDLVWHELTNAQRTRKILCGNLSGIERLDGGWVVAVIYYKGYRILITMEEMMINLEGDGREN